MKLSVFLLTYNHGRFIRQAIESALDQQTSFPFEIVVADDASTDGSDAIIDEYAAMRPDIVRPLIQQQNVGMYGNYVAGRAACRGEYIALLEGDDYWTEPTKLESQVAYLDAHPECSMVFHNCWTIYDDQSRLPEEFCAHGLQESWSAEDMLSVNPVPSCSAVTRAKSVPVIPEWTSRLPMIDWPSHVLHAAAGDVHYDPAIMGAYRVHEGGVWSSLSANKRDAGLLAAVDALDAHFGGRYTAICDSRRSLLLWSLATRAEGDGDRVQAGRYARRAARLLTLDPAISRRDLVKLAARTSAPGAYRLIKRLAGLRGDAIDASAAPSREPGG